MKLAFSGESKYPDFNDGYKVYLNRARGRECMDNKTYRRVIRKYCACLAKRLEKDGMVDLPNRIGSISTIILRRKARYKNNKFVGYGKYDWRFSRHDGNPIAFGVTFLPNRKVNPNLRCYGFVANRRLFQRLKETYDAGFNTWYPVELNDDMI